MDAILLKDRSEVLNQALLNTQHIPGNILEVGVYKGDTLKIMAETAKNWKKTVFGMDTFNGHPKPGPRDCLKEGTYSDADYDEVKKIEYSYPLLKIIKGEFPLNMGLLTPPYSFVHLDVDLYDGTLDSLLAVRGQISHGGIILVNNYGNETTPGVHCAVIDFLLGCTDSYRPFFRRNANQCVLHKIGSP